MTSHLSFSAHAKINWFLSVLKKRADGYHEIQSLMQCVSLSDDLSMELSAGIEVQCNCAIPEKDNLVYKAAKLLKERYKTTKGAHIKLQKRMPAQAGLGGGSSDAASALIGLVKLWGLNISTPGLMDIASEIGSDAPFFISGSPSIVSGRGDIIKPMSLKTTHALLLVKPTFGVSTKWAYKSLKRYGQEIDADDFISALEGKDYVYLKKHSINSLEGPAIKRHPEIADIKARLYGLGARFSIMSGSGSCVFGVFDTPRQAEDSAGGFPDCWTMNTVTIT